MHFRFSCKLFDGPLEEKLKKLEGYDRISVINPGAFIMPDAYRIYHKKFQDFAVNSSDIWVVTYPKAGKNVRLKLHFLKI